MIRLIRISYIKPRRLSLAFVGFTLFCFVLAVNAGELTDDDCVRYCPESHSGHSVSVSSFPSGKSNNCHEDYKDSTPDETLTCLHAHAFCDCEKKVVNIHHGEFAEGDEQFQSNHNINASSSSSRPRSEIVFVLTLIIFVLLPPVAAIYSSWDFYRQIQKSSFVSVDDNHNEAESEEKTHGAFLALSLYKAGFELNN